MATTRIRVDGLRELGERLAKLSSAVANRAAARSTAAAANIVKKATKENIRRHPSIQTGTLLNAVISKKIPKSQTTLTSEHIVTYRRKASGRKTKKLQATAPYANLIEFGTVKMPAEPSLGPAMDNNVDRCIEAIKTVLTNEIEKADAG